MENNLARLFIFSGRPGSGKTSIVKRVLELRPNLTYVRAITTREPRESDLLGQYRHVTMEEFARDEKAGKILMPVSIHGYRSGIFKDSLDEVRKGSSSFLIVLVPSFVPEVLEYVVDYGVPFYILSPSEKILRERLQKRGDDSDAIERKLEESREWDVEAKNSNEPFIFIKNDGGLEEAVRDVLQHIDIGE